MKRILILILIIALIAMCLTACAEQEQPEPDVVGGLVVIGKSEWENQVVLYDPDTMVMYVFVHRGSGGGLTPLYNADGSLKLWEVDE